MALVKFVVTDAAGYAGLGTKEDNALYFVTDTRKIYKGNTEFGMKFASVPAGGWNSVDPKDTNTIYREEGTFHLCMWSGSQWINLSLPVQSTVTESTQELASNKAIRDYVTSQLTDLDVGALEGRVDTLEGQVTIINGAATQEGSIAKAEQDAKDYADSLAPNYAPAEHDHVLADITDAGALAALDEVAEANLEATLAAKINGKADKATTLAGYGITDAYTTTQTDSKIAEAIAAAPHLKRAIVEELPEVGSADANTIYMVPQGEGTVDDPGTSASHYNEYMLINGAFELIGTSQVDLTGYATETFVTEAIGALDVADTAVANQYVSQVVETDGKIAVTRVPLPVTSVTEGSANGTIAVNGADVNVHGLGSAAYTESTAYETAGAAAAAVAALDKPDSAQEGQYVSAVSQENGVITVTRAALPQAPEITTGSTNGTISVGGEDVAVKGLGTAAYQNTEAFDAAGDADQALADAKEYVNGLLSWVEL